MSALSSAISGLSDAEWTSEARALINRLKYLLTPTDEFDLYFKKKVLFMSDNGCMVLYARNGRIYFPVYSSLLYYSKVTIADTESLL